MESLFLNISYISLLFSDLTRHGEQLINNGLNNPTPLTILIVFTGGLLTSLGPCSLSLLPITVAYLAGFKNNQNPLQKTISFCSGIVFFTSCIRKSKRVFRKNLWSITRFLFNIHKLSGNNYGP